MLCQFFVHIHTYIHTYIAYSQSELHTYIHTYVSSCHKMECTDKTYFADPITMYAKSIRGISYQPLSTSATAHMYIHTYIYVYVCTIKHTYVWVKNQGDYVYVNYGYTHMYVCTYVLYIRTYIHKYVRIHIYVQQTYGQLLRRCACHAGVATYVCTSTCVW